MFIYLLDIKDKWLSVSVFYSGALVVIKINIILHISYLALFFYSKTDDWSLKYPNEKFQQKPW